MKFSLVALLALFMAAVFCSKFDLLEYHLMWPPSDCINVPQCRVPKLYQLFSIHTVVPAYMNGSIPENCDPSYPFNAKEIESIEVTLATEWPDFYNFTHPEAFWATQWKTHGTCSLKGRGCCENEYEYFHEAMKLRSFFDLKVQLALKDIVPSKEKKYSYNDFMKVLEEKYKDMAMICRGDTGGSYYLHEFVFCFDDEMHHIDCPAVVVESSRSHCPSDLDEKSIVYLVNE